MGLYRAPVIHGLAVLVNYVGVSAKANQQHAVIEHRVVIPCAETKQPLFVQFPKE
jgi:hypothetical protein